MSGRFAPTPSAGLHLGNLRTALVAWLFARSSGREFKLRIEDLDQARTKRAVEIAQTQILDLARLGLDFDGEVMWQSSRTAIYQTYADQLADRLYECFCTRAEIAQSAAAPHGDGFRPYPGTCRELTAQQCQELAKTRTPALRIRADGVSFQVHDHWAGDYSARVDDFVVRRNDGVWAYNFAVVIDDIAQGVDQVVRGADLLSSAPRQGWLTSLLGGIVPEYAHIGLVTASDGERLAKRDRARTLFELATEGIPPSRVLALLGRSLQLCEADETVTATQLLSRFNPEKLSARSWSW